MGRSHGQIQIFSTSFLDLLSCAMGALVLVALVFAAAKNNRAQVKGKTCALIVRGTGTPQPELGLRLRIKREGLGPTDSPAPASKVHLLIEPRRAQAPSYTVLITGEDFHPDDFIEVYLADRNGSSNSSCIVEAEYIGVESEIRPIPLDINGAKGPVRRLRIQGFGAPGFAFEWKDPP